MSTTPSNSSDVEASDSKTSQDPQQIETEIAQHRQELGETVDELTERLDVKKQAQRKVDALKAQASTQLEMVKARAQSDDPKEVVSVLAPVVGVVAVVVLLVGIRRLVRR